MRRPCRPTFHTFPNSLRYRIGLEPVRVPAFLCVMESCIHQLNEVNKNQLCPTISSNTSNKWPPCTSGKDPFTRLQVVLSERGLLTKRIEEELSEGLQYWKLEQTFKYSHIWWHPGEGWRCCASHKVEVVQKTLASMERNLTFGMGQTFLEECIFYAQWNCCQIGDHGVEIGIDDFQLVPCPCSLVQPSFVPHVHP